MSRQDISRWVGLAAEWLRPIYQIILGGIWGDGYAQIDETVVKYLEPGRGRAQHGYFWWIKRPGGDAAFHWATSRAASVLEKIVPADFSGTLQSDNYSAYPSFAKRHGQPLTLAACWAHARREFFEASQTGAHKADARLILLLISRLYEVEARLQAKRASAKLRAVTRQAASLPILERIGRILRHWQRKGRHFPTSQMGKAVNYTLSVWAGLSVFIEDGRVEPKRSGDSQPQAARRASAARQIDNNPVENAIRPTAVGKKNYPSLRSGSAGRLRFDDAAVAAGQWLFIGDAQSGERRAIVFTVIEACRRRGINPFDYLRDVFTRMPLMAAADYPSRAPDAWMKS